MIRFLSMFLLFGSCSVFAQSVDFDGKSYPRRGWDDPLEAEYTTTVTREVKTPHLPTAVPYSQGPTRVLFITPRNAARPTIELCQRFDLEERHALVARHNTLTEIGRQYMYGLPGDTEEEVQRSLSEGLAGQPEVIVVNDFSWRLLPEPTRRQIADLVQAGAGLVLWNLEEGSALPQELAQFAPAPGPAADILACVPAEVRHRFTGLAAFTPANGGGRVVAITARDVELMALVGRTARTGQVWEQAPGHASSFTIRSHSDRASNPNRSAVESGGDQPGNLVQFERLTADTGVAVLQWDVLNPPDEGEAIRPLELALRLYDSVSGADLGIEAWPGEQGTLWLGTGTAGPTCTTTGAGPATTTSARFTFRFDVAARTGTLSWVDLETPAYHGTSAVTWTEAFEPDEIRLSEGALYSGTSGGFDNIALSVSDRSAGQATPARSVFADDFEGPPRLFSYLDDEDLYAVVGRAALWAAKRESKTKLDVTIFGGMLRAEPTGPSSGGAQIEAAIYDPTAVLRHELEHTAAVRPGEPWKLPPLKAGSHWVRLTLRDGEKVVDWTTRQVHVAAPVAIESISFESDHVPQDGTLTTKIRLSGNGLGNYRLSYRLADTWGRVIARSNATPGSEVTLNIAVRDCLSPMCFLVVGLERDGHVVAENRAWFTVAQPPPDAEEFHGAVWPMIVTADGPIWKNWLTVMQQRAGMGFVLGEGHKPSAGGWPVYLLNVRPYVYAINHHPDGLTEGLGGPARTPCLTDEEHNRAVDITLAERARDSYRFSPICYTDCGDALLHRDGNDVCFCESCTRDFRAYLKTRYASLQDLNRNWDAQYKDWSEVAPVTLADLEAWKNDDARPKPSAGQYARWVEHRMHMESVFADRHRRDREVIRTIDPEARTGMDAVLGNCSSFAGIDFSKLFEFMGAFGPYQNPFKLQVARSLAPPGTLLGCWVGGGYPQYRTQPYATATAWMLLFQRFNMQLFFVNALGEGDSCPMFAPDLRPYPVLAEQIRQLREVQSGTARLLLSARRENDGIAFLYSPASLHAATLTRGMERAELKQTPKYNSGWLEYETANEAMALLVTDLGFQYEHVTEQQVADGRLTRDAYRVLVLSSAQALSEETAAAIRRFVAGGGVVLADLRPGIFDEHGRWLKQGGLDDLFGIERAAGFPEPLTFRSLTPVAGDDELPALPVDHQVRVTSAVAPTAAGPPPSFIVRPMVKGRAILLNFDPSRYIGLRVKGEGVPLLQAFGSLLSAAGIQPRVRATSGQTAVPATEIVRFTHDANEYVGILRDHVLRWTWPITITNGEPAQAVVDFGRKTHVYDVRAGLYLGERQQVETTIVPAQAQLYALLPYQVKAVEATEAVSGPGPAKSFSLKVIAAGESQPGTHVLRIEVQDADGRPRPEYARNLKVAQGAGTVRLPLALSDPPGSWTITVRDAATGVAVESQFCVRGQ